jgi:hypothetical protein
MNWKATSSSAILCVSIYLSGCSPSVRLEAPDKPIEINMNVKIEHEIRLKVEKDVDELLSNQKGLF